MQVPPPRDWQVFERHMRDLFEAHWGARAEMHGRTGQPQHGVDIYGQPDGGDAYHGVQCKLHDASVAADITRTELEAEIKKATKFKPRLAHFILGTTAPRDANIQAVVRRLNARTRKPFTVVVLFWDDILDLYDQHRDVFDQHYRFFGAVQVDRLHQLRPPLKDFTGRQEEIDDLLAHIQQGVTISGVQGMGGIGKTELAYVIADRLKGDCPDAQLYLDLKGTSKEALKPADVLAFVIRCFHPEAKLPEDVGQLRGMYHSALNGKRVVLLMDNAAGPEQVEPLCPAPAGSVLLVTSRRHFTISGLYARNLDALPLAEACALLGTICPRIGDAAAEIAWLCGCLPLALRLAGSALTVQVTLTAGDYLRRLTVEDGRLKELGEVAASLALSEALLPEERRRQWHELAVFPGEFDLAAAAAVWAIDSGAAQDALDELHRYSVLECEETARRFRLHDLVRLFTDQRLDPADREAVRWRHAEHFEWVLRTADGLYLKGGEHVIRGLALLDLERSNIEAGFAWAAVRAGEDDAAARLCSQYPNAGAYCLDLRQHPRERIVWLEAALTGARRLNHRAAQGAHLGNLGLAYNVVGKPRQAIEFYERSLAIAREMHDHRSEAASLAGLGNAHSALGELPQAIELLKQALDVARGIPGRRGQGNVLGDLGLTYRKLGEPQRAIDVLGQVLEIMREVGDRRGEGDTLGGLGNAYADLGEPRRAIGFYEQQLAITRKIGHRRGEANACWNIGLAYESLGDLARAAELMQVLVDYEREIGHPDAEKHEAYVAALRARGTNRE